MLVNKKKNNRVFQKKILKKKKKEFVMKVNHLVKLIRKRNTMIMKTNFDKIIQFLPLVISIISLGFTMFLGFKTIENNEKNQEIISKSGK